MFCLLKF